MTSGEPHGHELAYAEPEKIKSLDAEFLSGHRFPYQEDMSLVEDVDLLAATPGEDINWLEDIALLEEDGVPAVFDRYRTHSSRSTSRSLRVERTRSRARCS